MFNLTNPPDPALRQPFTTTAFLPFFSSHYVLAVLVVLPHTFFIRLSFIPYIVREAWYCAVRLNYSAGLARSWGYESADRLNHYNLGYVIGVITITLRSLEWALTREPLQRYEPFSAGPNTLVKRPLSVSNVLLDACDLVFNQRGIGWSWSNRPSPRAKEPFPSKFTLIAKFLLKLVIFDIAHYFMQSIRPSLNDPKGDTLFDPTMSLIPRWALAGFLGTCAAVVIYTTVDVLYHFATLIGVLLLRQPEWAWPPISDRPWTSTSIIEFWSFRWHQFFRHMFVVYGARPGGALLGKPGACIGAFIVSAAMHDLGLWGLGRGIECRTTGTFFVLMGLGIVFEFAFKWLTGRRVGGFWGWLWTMLWTMCWGTMMIDGWARRGIVASDFFPEQRRPGKWLVETVVGLSGTWR